ncbi:MAG TPA: metallophosphoesterase family protein [Gemmatimonadota bacterium]|nr:metallophosphoesterase family protein [Gemmatimonadota bacterium]
MIRRTASRFGLVADVHANLHALNAVLAALAAEGVEEIWCLGDVVGYGGDPEACVAIVRERCAGTVRGNHDAAAVEAGLRAGFNPHAREAIERQAEILSPDALEWLRGLPSVLELEDVVLLHASFVDPDDFPYVLGGDDAARELGVLPGRWGFYGHTHVPALWWRNDAGTVVDLLPSDAADAAELDHPGRFLVNPGAVGQPRDGDPRAACAIFDRASGRLRLLRVDYDVAGAQSSILRAGMPRIEADRLERGL